MAVITSKERLATIKKHLDAMDAGSVLPIEHPINSGKFETHPSIATFRAYFGATYGRELYDTAVEHLKTTGVA